MKKITTKILQQRFSVNKFENQYDNYLILVEIIDGKPVHSYVVPMFGFKFWDEDLSYYPINNNWYHDNNKVYPRKQYSLSGRIEYFTIKKQ